MEYNWIDILTDITLSRIERCNGHVIYTLVFNQKDLSVYINLSTKKVLEITCPEKSLKIFLEHNKNVLVGFAMMFEYGFSSVMAEISPPDDALTIQ